MSWTQRHSSASVWLGGDEPTYVTFPVLGRGVAASQRLAPVPPVSALSVVECSSRRVRPDEPPAAQSMPACDRRQASSTSAGTVQVVVLYCTALDRIAQECRGGDRELPALASYLAASQR
jgi:hypothetical protein